MSERFDPVRDLPLATAELPGTGGTIRAVPEDFEVEELPAYEPCGEGQHLFLWVEKRGRNTRDVASELARALGISERDVGVAGQKDRNALTRQFLSVPGTAADKARGLAGDGWQVLRATAHGNKLKTGHLRGNRFTLRVRGCVPDALARATAIAAALEARGLPNAYGAQRFGRDGANVRIGRALVRGERTPETGRAARDRFLRRMVVSAFQAMLFNQVLAERMRDGLLSTAVRGDLMKKIETGGLFTCQDPDVDGPRVERMEITPTGPIFGHRMMQPEAEALEREQRVLATEGLELASFAPLRADGEGSRRPMRLPVKIGVTAGGESELVLSFALEKGSYATQVLREVMKTEALPELPGDRED